MADPGYHVTVVTPPAATPVTLAETKAHLRVLHASEDALIERLIKTATASVERTLGRSLVSRQLVVSYDRLPLYRVPLALPRPPVVSVAGLDYLDADGVAQTIASDGLSLIQHVCGAAAVPLTGDWPKAMASARAVTVRYTAGYGAAASDVPEDIRHAALMMVEHLYYHRAAVSEGGLAVTPMGVDALLSPHMTSGWI